MADEDGKNAAYILAEKISITKKEEKLIKLSSKLNTLIADSFEKSDIIDLEDALKLSIKNEETEITNILMEEIHFEIEQILFENDKSEDFDSTMMLMPCVLVSHEKQVTIPSIQIFESIIAKKLVEVHILDNIEQFRFGSVRLVEDDLDNMNLQNWWDLHRDIIDDLDGTNPNTEQNKILREKNLQLKINKKVFLFYLVPVLINKDNNEEIVNNIYESHMDIEFWNSISQEISESSNASFTLLPPMPLSESIEHTKYIMQNIEFDTFFRDFAYEDSVEVGYIKVTDLPDDYIVLFFDGEDQTLSQFFRFETDGDANGFLALLIEKCIENPMRTLYSFDTEITLNTLEAWGQTEDGVDISELLKQSNIIDLTESHRMCMISNPYLDGNDNNEQTIH